MVKTKFEEFIIIAGEEEDINNIFIKNVNKLTAGKLGKIIMIKLLVESHKTQLKEILKDLIEGEEW